MVRIDGRAFTNFCSAHDFEKPNDMRQIHCMNAAAREVMVNFSDIFLAYGQSDEYSFCFRKSTRLFNRREDKILSCLVSLFTASYVMNFDKFFS